MGHQSMYQPEYGELHRLYLEEFHSIAAIAKLASVSAKVVRSRLVAFGIPRRRTGPLAGALHPGWRGGVTVKGGYVYRYVPNHPNAQGCYVRESRLILERSLGRYLHPSEVVHHIDGDPSNNALSNLRLYSDNAEHLRMTLTGKCPHWTPEGHRAILEACCKPRVAHPPLEILRQLYIHNGLSCASIGRRLGCSEELVRNDLQRAGIPRRRSGGRLHG